MSWQTASAWNLDSGQPREWIVRAACRGSDPDMFTVPGKNLSPENQVALALCSSCPVQLECREMYLNAGRNSSIVAGGWWWDDNGQVHRTGGGPPARRRRRVNEHVLGARNAITAARAKLINPDLTYKDAAARYGSNFRAVCDGVFIGRYAPDLLHAVWNGRRTLASAFAEATQRRSETEGVAS